MKQPCDHQHVRRWPLAIALLNASVALGGQLTPLGVSPDWSRLNVYQKTMPAHRFVEQLTHLFAPSDAWSNSVQLHEAYVDLLTGGPPFHLDFAPTEPPNGDRAARFWRSVDELSPAPIDRPLEGVRIVLDPGHLGGPWAKMEERWFQIGNTTPVTEGDLTLRVAQLLQPRLTALGAIVTLTRNSSDPVTPQRPNDFLEQARLSLQQRGIHPIVPTYRSAIDPMKEHSIQWEAEKLFYRIAEIHARAHLVNDRLKPDLVVCLHFNAEPWFDPANPTLVDTNHLHLIVNGNYGPGELVYDDTRFEMFERLLNQPSADEQAISEQVAESLAAVTRLPPYQYGGSNARPVGKSGYLWARDLLANRLYLCPVIYVECYVMNDREFFDRFQAGEYPGWRDFNGVAHKNIYAEYCDGVTIGLEQYFFEHRKR
ncbi:MAG: N-acetylmuramoyl-L-alanine amidase [Verrucomicrobia bacterium]|nr:N-acetylmuramoyl-L-alanine amidase [Verrucomicrobiota bacterium]